MQLPLRSRRLEVHARKLVLSFLCLFTTASMVWSQTFTNGDWAYTVTNNLATITKYSGFSFAVSIPSTVSGYTVTSIGSGALNGRSNMTSVDIPSTITNIGDGAFGSCGNLRSVVIPSSVRQLGVSAFVGCLQLTDLTIAHGLTTIPAYAFADCPLANVTIAASVTNILPVAAFQGGNGGKFLFLGNAPAGLALGNFPNSFRIYRLAGSSGFPAYVGSNAVQVTSLYTQADPTNGLFTQAQYDANRTNGRADVTNNPWAYNLFTQTQYDGNRDAGRIDVISDPASYSLYTADSIMDLRMGGVMLQKQGSNALVTFQPQTTTDLAQPFTNNGAPMTNEIPMPGNKGFIRIQANP